MAEAVFRVTTEYAVNSWGLITPRGGEALAAVGHLVTEHMIGDAKEAGVELADGDGIILLSPRVVVSAAQGYLRDLAWRQEHPQEAAEQERPRLILPGEY